MRFSERRATGVVCRRGDKRNGAEETIDAHRAVILSAGAFQSPQLLLLSGIGPPDELARHGIAVAARAAGRRPQPAGSPRLHADLHGQAARTCSASRRRALARLPREILRWRRERRGLLTTNFAESGGFLKTDPALPRPDIQLHFVVGLVDDHARKRHFATGYSLHVCVLRPKSRGSVGLADADPMSAPRIDPAFLSDRGRPGAAGARA